MYLKSIIYVLLFTMCLPANSKKVTSITLAPHLTELVYSAGGEKSLIGVSAYSDFPDGAKKLPVIGDAFRLDYELIKTLNPDVVFYWKDGTANQVIQQLLDMELELHEININQLSDIPQAINKMAQVLGSQPTSTVGSFDNQLAALQQTIKLQSALIQLSAKPIYTVNAKHWMSEAIAVCGLENIFDQLEPLSAAVTMESIVLKKPEYIITTGPMPQNPLTAWQSIPAIKNDRVIALDPDTFSRPTLRLLDAIKVLCEEVNKSR